MDSELSGYMNADKNTDKSEFQWLATVQSD
jgi:hypothetical protein